MGKHWTFVLAFICVAAVLAIGLIARQDNPADGSSFYGTQTRAQELNPDRIMALMARDSVIRDAVAERSVIGNYGGDQMRVWATAYTSDPFETDATPSLTALGTKTKDGVAAANFLPFGTKFRIPELYGDKVFTVEDRLNSRYNSQRIVDIWMPVKGDAVHFGKKVLTLELL